MVERGRCSAGCSRTGLTGLVASLMHWQVNSFGALDPRESLRIVVPAATALIMSFQTIFASLFVSILGIRRRQHPPLTDPAAEAEGVVDAAVRKVAKGETEDASAEHADENGSGTGGEHGKVTAGKAAAKTSEDG